MLYECGAVYIGTYDVLYTAGSMIYTCGIFVWIH